MSESRISTTEVDELHTRISTVADEARCSLATQQQIVAASLLEGYPDVVQRHVSGRAAGVEPTLIAELVDILDGSAISVTWPPSSRNVRNGFSDYLGVTIYYQYQWKSGALLGSTSLQLTQTFDARIEPQSY